LAACQVPARVSRVSRAYLGFYASTRWWAAWSTHRPRKSNQELLRLGRCTLHRVCRTHSILRTLAVLACGPTWWESHADCFARAHFGDADRPQVYTAGSNQQSNDIGDRVEQHNGRDSARTLGIINERGGNDPRRHDGLDSACDGRIAARAYVWNVSEDEGGKFAPTAKG
jgi:hypothetical protein